MLFFPHTSTQGLARAGQRLICASVVLHPTCHLNMRPFSTQASSPMVAAHPFLLLTHTECRWPLLSWPSSLNTCISYLVCNQQNSRYLFTYLLCFAGYPFPTAPPVDPFAKIKVSDCGVTKGCIRLEIHLCLSLKRARVLL